VRRAKVRRADVKDKDNGDWSFGIRTESVGPVNWKDHKREGERERERGGR
jgi:hypothetical protein